jgi:stress response protein SCP2
MTTLTKGQRMPIANLFGNDNFNNTLGIGIAAQGLALDFACFGLDANGKLSDERYMCFFNQPKTPCGGVSLCEITGDAIGFSMDLNRLPASIERLVLTASVDGVGTLSALGSGYVRVLASGQNSAQELGRFAFTGSDFSQERAVMLAELYFKGGQWRFMGVGQGFNGGLDALVTHFGGSVAQAEPVVAPVVEPPRRGPNLQKRISLEKRIEKETPHLVSLVKSAGVSLEKVGLSQHSAKVCLVLDISGSMNALYRDGLVQKFAERILALGCKFDDDGEIDVFLFGQNVHQPAPMNLGNCKTWVQVAITEHRLEGDTRYGRAIEAVRRFYFPDSEGGERRTAVRAELPVYVMFVTDGTTSDKPLTEKQLRWASYEPIFWQFMGIGKGKKSKDKNLAAQADSDFPFLDKLDELTGRFIDNANYFSTRSPDEYSDDQLYDLLMAEYPGWIKLAQKKNMLP